MARQSPNRGANPQAGGFAAGRGLLIVLFATAVGVLLLARAVDPNSDAPATENASGDPVAAKTEDSTGAAPSDSTGTPPTAAPVTVPPKNEPAAVMVLVTNGSGIAGKAKVNTDELSINNYNILTPTDHPTPETATKVYFTPANQADAVAIAQLLSIGLDAVSAMPPAGFPGLDLGGAMVLVVLGADGQGIAV
ncbi:MAG: LytR C-terminal domain-containing protein [Acidimicrobiales bacterium]